MPVHVHLVIPGPIDQNTGGYLYDARVAAGLRAQGWRVQVHSLAGRFPEPDAVAQGALTAALSSMEDGAWVVVDGLAGGGLPGPLHLERNRLCLVALVHHPLADETGTSHALRDRFEASETAALAACRGVITTSATTARRVADLGVSSDRIKVVVPGTEPALPARGPQPRESPHLLCVATVTPRKGHDVLLNALHRVRNLKWTCACVGSLARDPKWAAHVLAQRTALGLQDRVTFTGEVDSLEPAYAAASAVVLASHYEGYGMVLSEAIARGLPVVSTTGGAIPETVPADAGVLVEPGDAEALGDALAGVLDPVRRARLASAARRHARQFPDWSETAKAFGRAVVTLVGHSRQSSL